MSKLSVLIPARNEPYLAKTVDDLFAKASGDIEVIVNLDGYWPDPSLADRRNLVLIHRGAGQGMRAGINSCAAIAKGEYLMKIDAHCMVGEGFDEVLKKDCEDDWVVVPRRLSLNAEQWTINTDNRKYPVDYHYLNENLHGAPWTARREARKDVMVDDEMASQGSCYFMARRHWDRLGGLHAEGYGQFVQEFLEVGMRTWLGPWDGRVVVNKNTWYAHWYKSTKRGWAGSRTEFDAGQAYAVDYWKNDRWPERKHSLAWLIDKFSPVPGWPAANGGHNA